MIKREPIGQRQEGSLPRSPLGSFAVESFIEERISAASGH